MTGTVLVSKDVLLAMHKPAQMSLQEIILSPPSARPAGLPLPYRGNGEIHAGRSIKRIAVRCEVSHSRIESTRMQTERNAVL